MSASDAASLAAAWVSAVVTTIGLSSVLIQVNTIRNQLDPFSNARGEEHLGPWSQRQRRTAWYDLAKRPPEGPVIRADLHKSLDLETLHLSRRPICRIGIPSWTVLLAVFHPHSAQLRNPIDSEETSLNEEKVLPSMQMLDKLHQAPPRPPQKTSQHQQWHQVLPTIPLIYYKDVACAKISRMTLIVFVLLSQGREEYRHDGSSGLRLGWASYNGFCKPRTRLSLRECINKVTDRFEWPLGERPTLHFEPHETFMNGKDPFPLCFSRRPRMCVQMAVGIIHRGLREDRSNRVAFSGRKKPGPYMLTLLPKRFGAQRSAADLYNKLGGEAHEVDFFFRERLEDESVPPLHVRVLTVPSLIEDESSTVYLRQTEATAIADCLDHLPWSPLAWSIHRGMKDILIAYAYPYMMAYREVLAEALGKAVRTHETALHTSGWKDKEFIVQSMAQQAESAVRGDGHCSGDVCRIISAIVESLWDKSQKEMDCTTFWSRHVNVPTTGKEVSEALTPDGVVALVKAFFVWWSHEFDYDIYYKLPLDIVVV